MSQSAVTLAPNAIADNLAGVNARIFRAAAEAGRPPQSVSLVCVSKTHDAVAVQAALEAGQRMFGENRVQEAETKFPELRAAWPDLELHLIGPLQTNKAKRAVELFDVIESVDRERLARALAREAVAQGRPLRVYVQVNTGEEPQKAGCLPTEVNALVALCRELGLDVQGLMCIPPADEEPAPHFALLAKMAARNELAGLSMGMSGDYETAIQFGATRVRVGSAIFGSRPPQTSEPAG